MANISETHTATTSLARRIARSYSALPQVEAVAWAGSHATGTAGLDSDIDLYVYTRKEIALAERRQIAAAHASHAEVGNQFWEPGDEWVDRETQIHVDVMFRACTWIEDQIARVLQRYEAAVGYSTCFWHNVLSSILLYDRQGWLHALQQGARQPYPAPLQQAVIAKNYPLLRRNQSAYVPQLARALARADVISVNHRVAAFFASYFDVIFALNRLPHPGEKRLLYWAAERCPLLPEQMAEQVQRILQASARPNRELLAHLHALLDRLDDLLRAHGWQNLVVPDTQSEHSRKSACV